MKKLFNGKQKKKLAKFLVIIQAQREDQTFANLLATVSISEESLIELDGTKLADFAEQFAQANLPNYLPNTASLLNLCYIGTIYADA